MCLRRFLIKSINDSRPVLEMLDSTRNKFCHLSACPYIFKKPSNTVANFGQSATFYCDGVAVSLLNFMWHKGDSIITQSKKYNLQNGKRKLVINDVSEEDIGEYKCVVTGVHGISSATARLSSVNGE